MDTIDSLNFDEYKKSHKDFNKFKKNLFNFLIKELPREFVLETLKKKKLVKQDWEGDHKKYIATSNLNNANKESE